MQKIGLGIVTYNRPKYLQKTMGGVINNLLPYLDKVVVYNDGSDVGYDKTYNWLSRKAPQVEINHSEINKGVAHAKNQLFKSLMPDCDFIFILEDDVVPVDKMAIIGYLAAAKMTGMDHFMFAHHGDGNSGYAVGQNGPVVYWPASVGAYCFYTKKILEEVGLMDETFHNAWEHVEHSWRIMKHHKSEYGYWPDVLSSELWLKEIPGSIEKSSIGQQDNPERLKVIIEGLEYWKQKDRDFPAQHTLDYYLGVQNDLTTTTH